MARPSKINTIDLKQLGKLAERGWTDEQMADFFGICRATLDNYKNENKELLDTLKRGKEISDARVERALFERAIGYEHPEDKIMQYEGDVIVEPTIKHYPPDTTAAIFWLKNRKPEQWREKAEIEHSGSVIVEWGQ